MALPPPVFERRRRFYEAVEVGPVPGGHAVRLDGRLPRSADGVALVVPTPSLARLIGEEWEAQQRVVEPAAMPATRLAWTALSAGARVAAVARIGALAAADLVCYFAEGPAALAERQQRDWGPLIAWAGRDLGARFLSTRGVIHQPQEPRTLLTIEALASAEDDFPLAGLDAAAALFGSAILGLALRRGLLSGEAAFSLSRLDETFQQERWGVDAEAAARTQAMAREAVMLERWFAALAAH